MRRNALLGVAFVLSSMLAVAVLARPPEVGPGGIWIQGTTNEYSNFSLDVRLQPGGPALFTILAAEVYSEPSHTFLAAIVDSAAPAQVLSTIQGQKPRAMIVTIVGQTEPHLTVPAPPATDTRIRIDYVIRKGQSVSTTTVSDAHLSSISDFEFSSTPNVGGGYYQCGYCGGTLCRCIYCPTPAVTLCCPSCTFECGFFDCLP